MQFYVHVWTDTIEVPIKCVVMEVTNKQIAALLFTNANQESRDSAQPTDPILWLVYRVMHFNCAPHLPVKFKHDWCCVVDYTIIVGCGNPLFFVFISGLTNLCLANTHSNTGVILQFLVFNHFRVILYRNLWLVITCLYLCFKF